MLDGTTLIIWRPPKMVYLQIIQKNDKFSIEPIGSGDPTFSDTLIYDYLMVIKRSHLLGCPTEVLRICGS